MRVETIETPELGDRSYLVSDGTGVVVIDPQRDLDRVERILENLAGEVTHVLETHVHNDYLSGGLELSRRTHASYGINAADPVEFERLPLYDGDALSSGTMQIRVLATPGHTETHLSYLVEDGTGSAVFTGGSLLFGSVGRTDLISPSRARALSLAQFASARRLAALPAATAVFPTHGFGSFCSSGKPNTATASTIGDEVQKNAVFQAESAEAFASDLLDSLDDYPAYYTSMAPLNLHGPDTVDLSAPMPTLSPDEVAVRLRAGEVVVDLRDRVAYSAAHAPNTVSIECGSQLATYLGWLVPFGTPVTLIAETPDDLDAARRQLARIGYDKIAGTTARIETLGTAAAYPRATWDQLAAERRQEDVVLDVRQGAERERGWLPGSVHVPLHELPTRVHTLPRQRIWVHCASGFRAGTAASILHNAGFDVVHVDDQIEHADQLGLVTS